MSQEQKRLSKLNETDEVALHVAAKNHFANEKLTEVRKATIMICTWFMAKAILAPGPNGEPAKIGGRDVRFAGIVSGYNEKGQAQLVRAKDDLDDDQDFDSSDEDFNEAKAAYEEQLLSRSSELDRRQAELDRREAEILKNQEQAKENPFKAAQGIIKEEAEGKQGEVKTDSNTKPAITNPDSSMAPNPNSKQPVKSAEAAKTAAKAVPAKSGIKA